MTRRPPRSTLDLSSAASEVYKRQVQAHGAHHGCVGEAGVDDAAAHAVVHGFLHDRGRGALQPRLGAGTVSYTHLRAHETVLDLVCRLLLEKKKQQKTQHNKQHTNKQQSTPTIFTTHIRWNSLCMY